MAPVKTSPSSSTTAPSRFPSAPQSTPRVEPPPAATPTAPPTRRVAQFITADVAQSQLAVAADGKLPELHLNADEAGPRKRITVGGSNSWGMVVLVSLSLLASLAIFLIPGPSNGPGPTRSANQHRENLRKKYLGDDAAPLHPYQIELRKALQAHDRGDLKSERQYYLNVLGMLRDENLHPQGRNLTGLKDAPSDPDILNDQHLEEIIYNLLGQR